MDLLLSTPGLRVGEIRTGSMPNMVAMYRTPAYKWMALHAREFDFHPYGREPWHWEYNPVGFAERFEREVPPAAQGHTYGAPLGLFERYPGGALDALPARRVAVPRVVDVRDRTALGLQVPAQPAAPIDWCRIRAAIASTARAEERRWTRPNGTKIRESEPGQLPILQQYWQAVPGFASPAAALAQAQGSAADNELFAWSAAFICHVMRTAGVTPAHGFGFGGAHIHYMVGALRNRERSDQAKPFWLLDGIEIVNEVTVEPGDLICMNRIANGRMTDHSYTSLREAFWGSSPDGGRAARRPEGSSHCTLVVGIGQDAAGRFAETIGGNEADSVRLNNSGRIAINAGGGIENPAAHHIFGLIKLMECRA